MDESPKMSEKKCGVDSERRRFIRALVVVGDDEKMAEVGEGMGFGTVEAPDKEICWNEMNEPTEERAGACLSRAHKRRIRSAMEKELDCIR